MKNTKNETAKSKNMELQTTQSNRPKKGRGGTHNFPNARMEVDTPEKKAFVTKVLGEVYETYTMPKVKSDDELEERLNAYFYRCAQYGIVPTVEEMCMYTGHSMAMVNGWECGAKKGFSPQTCLIIKRAKDFMRAYDAKSVLEGKQNPIVYFFRAKNYYGMSDKQELVVTPNSNQEEIASPEEIAEKYLAATATEVDG